MGEVRGRIDGIRAIERITDIHRDTVSDLVTDLIRHAKQVNDLLLKDVKLTHIQLDEFWTYIKKAKETYQKGLSRDWRLLLLHSIES